MAPANKIALLRLPVDPFYLITDKLDLHDRFFLSQTCQAFRNLFHQEWDNAMSHLDPDDRLRFFAGLAYALPDYWACSQCCKLHPINTTDTPETPWGFACLSKVPNRPTRYCYEVREHHVQSALKLSRMGNQHEEYCSRLMSPYKVFYSSRSWVSGLNQFVYTATPRIIGNRFILQEEWIFSCEGRISHTIYDEFITIPGCSHVNVLLGRGIVGSQNIKSMAAMRPQQMNNSTPVREIHILETLIRSAMSTRDTSLYYSCPRCRTDGEVFISEDVRSLTVRVWHDFGGEGAPVDTDWNAHAWSSDSSNWFYEGPGVPHEENSIRELWSASTS